MKKVLFTLMLVLAASASLGAQTLGYLTVRTADGGERSLPIDGLKLTFEDGCLVARASEAVASYPLGDLDLMYFSAQPTAIASLSPEQAAPVYRDGLLTVSAPAGTRVLLYSADGRLVSGFVKETDGSESFAPGLPSGVYVVSANGKTAKFLAR